MTTAKKTTTGNLDLWGKVCITDPAFTKIADTRGGFTTINATWQAWQATELWGPYGEEWGVQKLDYQFIGEAIHPAAISLVAVFFSPVSTFEIATDMPYAPNNDCFKKLLTDLTTKALSKLGFSADVFLGKYDDSRYVREAAANYEAHREEQGGAPSPTVAGQGGPDLGDPPPGGIEEVSKRLVHEDKDLVKAWAKEPLETEGQALRAVAALVGIVMKDTMPKGWDDDINLYKETKQKMNTVIDKRAERE